MYYLLLWVLLPLCKQKVQALLCDASTRNTPNNPPCRIFLLGQVSVTQDSHNPLQSLLHGCNTNGSRSKGKFKMWNSKSTRRQSPLTRRANAAGPRRKRGSGHAPRARPTIYERRGSRKIMPQYFITWGKVMKQLFFVPRDCCFSTPELAFQWQPRLIGQRLSFEWGVLCCSSLVSLFCPFSSSFIPLPLPNIIDITIIQHANPSSKMYWRRTALKLWFT